MSTPTQAAPLLTVEGLVKHFPVRTGLWAAKRWVRAVDGVSFTLGRGETLGLVGESGCGKSTVGRCVLRLIEPTSGQLRFAGQDLLSLDARSLRRLRPRLQLVFQDPYGSLNPRMNVGDIVGEAVAAHGLARGAELRAKVEAIIERVGLPRSALDRYPHEFSGGQRQRVGIARALVLGPELVVCDEPVSALDVSVQASILNLLADLQQELGLAYLFIAHDLHVVRHVSQRIAVMYLGQIVELAPADALFGAAAHPYTEALLAAVPSLPGAAPLHRHPPLRGELPSPLSPPSGCRFHPRCPKRFGRCSVEAPPEHRVGEGHWVRCHLFEERGS